MKNLIIAVMLAAAPAAAQEFAAGMPILRDLLAKTEALKAAAASDRAMPALPALAYDPREIRFEALTTGDKAIHIYHKEQRLAILHIGGAMIGGHVVFKLIGHLEASRRRAVAQGRRVSIDDAAITLYNETGFLNRIALEEPERFGAIVRVTDEAVFP